MQEDKAKAGGRFGRQTVGTVLMQPLLCLPGCQPMQTAVGSGENSGVIKSVPGNLCDLNFRLGSAHCNLPEASTYSEQMMNSRSWHNYIRLWRNRFSVKRISMVDAHRPLCLYSSRRRGSL